MKDQDLMQGLVVMTEENKIQIALLTSRWFFCYTL